MTQQTVAILGSTGSIGVSTLDVCARHSDRYKVFALSAQSSYEQLFEQIKQCKPQYAVLVDEQAADQLAVLLKEHGSDTVLLQGVEALNQVASHQDVDVVMAAIVGAAGLESTLAAAKAGKRVLLANKEALVTSGHLFMDAISENNAQLLPIDSEHNAIFQCLPADHRPGLNNTGVSKILLTGSGGPFRNTPLSELHKMTPDQACAHPNWSMGRKISVDSATMMNKGLELVEACWLFGVKPDFIDIVIHPQSVIHSMVQYIDGSVLAQLGNPDMRTPIAYGLAWPERIDSGVAPLDMIATARLDFTAPDYERFPCLRLTEESLLQGGSALTVLNAANEVAVAAFLDEQIKFTDIPLFIEKTLEKSVTPEPLSLDVVKTVDSESRQLAQELILQAQ